MEEVVRLKFSQHPALKEELLSTGDAPLIEVRFLRTLTSTILLNEVCIGWACVALCLLIIGCRHRRILGVRPRWKGAERAWEGVDEVEEEVPG